MQHTRKLHVIHDIPAKLLRVQVCLLDDVQRERKLVSSTDGIIAMEVHTRAKPTVRGWRCVATHTITDYPSPPLDATYPLEVAQLARRAAMHVANTPSISLVVVEIALGRAVGATGFLFSLVLIGDSYQLDASLAGLPCDRPIA